MIEDLSYSGLTDLIQGDLSKGKDAIIELSQRFVSTDKEVKDAEYELNILKGDRDALYGGVQKVMKHLDMAYPLAAKVEEGIIVISEKTITLETNVI